MGCAPIVGLGKSNKFVVWATAAGCVPVTWGTIVDAIAGATLVAAVAVDVDGMFNPEAGGSGGGTTAATDSGVAVVVVEVVVVDWAGAWVGVATGPGAAIVGASVFWLVLVGTSVFFSFSPVDVVAAAAAGSTLGVAALSGVGVVLGLGGANTALLSVGFVVNREGTFEAVTGWVVAFPNENCALFCVVVELPPKLNEKLGAACWVEANREPVGAAESLPNKLVDVAEGGAESRLGFKAKKIAKKIIILKCDQL